MKKLIFIFFCLTAASALYAQERILDFTATAQVQKDGKVNITETIEVQVEHNQIKRGIFRNIPLSKPQTLQVNSLKMDGLAHPYFIETAANTQRINFGNDAFIPQGPHTYVLSYTMDHVLGRFKNYDEIYWNITGNDWAFPIEKASGQVILPADAEVLENKISVYTGKYGSKTSQAKQNKLHFTTSAPLQPGEGMTVAIPFKKGILEEDPVIKQIQTYSALLHILLTVLLGISAFYAWHIWKKAGKDPMSHVIRQYTPPENTSPAMARYIWKMDWDTKIFIVTLCSLAMKKVINIREERNFTVTKLSAKEEPDLFSEEKYLLDKLPDSLEITDHYNPQVKKIFSDFASHFKKYSRADLFFSKNTKISETLFVPLFIFAAIIFSKLEIVIAFVLLVLGMFLSPFINITLASAFVKFSVFLFLISNFCTILGTPGIFVASLCAIIGIFITTKNADSPFFRWSFCLISIALLWTASQLPQADVVLFLWSILFGIYSAVIIFFIKKIMPAYSVRGRQIMDQIEGFRQYLQIGEKERVKESNPTDPLKIFCDYLPYALALDVENKWIKAFESLVGTAAVQQAAAQRGFSGYYSLDKNLHAFSRSCIRCNIQPSTQGNGSSHSGSGGGGFSGGGFGGGGGGGR